MADELVRSPLSKSTASKITVKTAPQKTAIANPLKIQPPQTPPRPPNHAPLLPPAQAGRAYCHLLSTYRHSRASMCIVHAECCFPILSRWNGFAKPHLFSTTVGRAMLHGLFDRDRGDESGDGRVASCAFAFI